MRRLITLLTLLMLTVSGSLAQSDNRGDLFGSGAEIRHVYQQMTPNGTITSGATPEMLTLTLNDVAPSTDIIQIAPPSKIEYTTSALASNWDAAIELAEDDSEIVMRAAGELNLDGMIIVLVLTSAEYNQDSNTMIYEAELITAVEVNTALVLDAEAAAAKLPTDFNRATLTVSLTRPFWQGLQLANETQREDTRGSLPEDCAIAEDVLANPDDYTLTEYYQARAYYNNNCR